MGDQDIKPVETCCLPRSNEMGGLCPNCGSRGQKVDVITLRSLLSVSLTKVSDTPHWFCREVDCSVVYFSLKGSETFTLDQLRERVFQKEPDAEDVWVCYCFRHTRQTMLAELAATGLSTVIETINAGIQAGQCACEVRNPQGSCCLGNVKSVVKTIKESFGT